VRRPGHQPVRPSPTVAGRRRADGRDRMRLRRRAGLLAAVAGGLRRHAQPVERRRQRLPAARAVAARPVGGRPRPHRALCPLQPRRIADGRDRHAARDAARHRR
jgi:hypothetical protein